MHFTTMCVFLLGKSPFTGMGMVINSDLVWDTSVSQLLTTKSSNCGPFVVDACGPDSVCHLFPCFIPLETCRSCPSTCYFKKIQQSQRRWRCNWLGIHMPLSYKRQGSIKPRGVEKSLVKDLFLLGPKAVCVGTWSWKMEKLAVLVLSNGKHVTKNGEEGWRG